MNEETNAALHAIAEAIAANAAHHDAWHDPGQLATLGGVVLAFVSLAVGLVFQRRQHVIDKKTLENENIKLMSDLKNEGERLANERTELQNDTQRLKSESEKLRIEAAGEQAKLALELRIRRLDEFYGRIQIQMGLSILLYQKLVAHGPKANDWSYLLNVDAVNKSAVDRALMGEIIEVNRVINDLISTRGGLIRERNDLFSRFQTHFRLVDSAFKGTAVPELKFADTYPREFDTYIHQECETLRREIDEIDKALLEAKDALRVVART